MDRWVQVLGSLITYQVMDRWEQVLGFLMTFSSDEQVDTGVRGFNNIKSWTGEYRW